jgi:hypothetical protein
MQNLFNKSSILTLSTLAFTSSICLSEAALPWQFGFQAPATPYGRYYKLS